jgi:cellulose synthase/poly-beta-1,6-N-acetylglucosamine synthase-like glycosyltransferase
VICVRNGEAFIRARINNLEQQAGMVGGVEWIIVSDGSTDGTVDSARTELERCHGAPQAVGEDWRGLPGNRFWSYGAEPDPKRQFHLLAFDRNRGKAAVLNEVIPKCTGSIVVLTDVRQSFAPDATKVLCEGLQDPQVGALSGELCFRSDRTGDSGIAQGVDAYWRYEKWLRRMESRIDSTCGCTGAIYAIRRTLFQPIDPSIVLDDMAIPLAILLRSGHRILFEERALAYDDPSRVPSVEQARKVRTLAGNLQLCQKSPALLSPSRNRIFFQFVSHKLLRLVCPFALVAMLLGCGVLANHVTWAKVLLGAQVAFYVTAWLVGREGEARGRGLLSLPRAFVLLNLAAVKGVVHYLRGGLDGRWEPTGAGGRESVGRGK